MSRISVLFMIDKLRVFAGSERNLFEVVTRIDQEKFKPLVVCLQSGSAADHVREKGFDVIDLDIKKIYSLQAIPKIFKMIKIIKKENVKIAVTYHEGSDYFGSIVSRLAGVPVVISSRRDMGYRLKKRNFVVYRYINRLFDRIITVSEAVKDIIINREDVPCSRLTTIHNGVDLEEFSNAAAEKDIEATKNSFGIKEGQPVVGIIAAVRPVKGHKYFIEAAAEVLKEKPGACFLIVGWYEESNEYFKELKTLIEKLNIGKNIIFTGGYPDISKIMSIIDISVIASDNEGFSNAVIEAMASGKPVIATNTGGTPEAVIDGKTGILVPPADPGAVAAALIKLLSDKGRIEKMAIEARKCAQEKFSMEGMIQKIEDLYEKMLMLKDIKKKRRTIRPTLMMVLKKWIKVVLGRLLYYSGLFFLYRTIVPAAGGIKILAYHRVNDICPDMLYMNVKVENFEKQMKYIKKYCNQVSLEEAVCLLKDNKKIPDHTVVITFDDGYLDNYTEAFPILRHYNIPATVFLSTGEINSGLPFWYDRIAISFMATEERAIDLEPFVKGKYQLESEYDRYQTARKVIEIAKYLTKEERNELLNSIVNKLKIGESVKKNNAHSVMTWDQIKSMKEHGITFGGHGVTHSILTALSEDQAEYEIVESKRIIDAELNTGNMCFAYPNGQPEDYNDSIKEMVRKAGYLAAVTLKPALNYRNGDPYALNRHCISSGTGNGISGKFSKSLFSIYMAGFTRRKRTSVDEKTQ
ncbi:glycosyltransferase [Elusimicrobiota bacterium]